MTATHERQGREVAAPIARDEVLRVGPEGQLVGIVSHPCGGPPRGVPAPAVVFLNAGVLHRVGPHRLHVLLARRLAEEGFAGLRLDLGGIGDSTVSSDAPTFRESAVADTRAAMTGLADATGARAVRDLRRLRGRRQRARDGARRRSRRRHRPRRSGGLRHRSQPAPRAARRGSRAAGPSRGCARACASSGARSSAALARLRRPTGEVEPPSEGREPPPLDTFRIQLATLVERGVRIFAVYSGIHRERYNHADQLFELIPELRGRIDLAYFPAANHTFTELDAQAALIAAVTRWISTRFA